MSVNRQLFDFGRPGEPDLWRAVDDRVMGGVSASQVIGIGGGLAVFCGEVSLENNGGFASVHAAVRKGILEGCQDIRLHCRGDGRTYSLRLRQDDDYDGISWRCDFTPAAGEWQAMSLPLKAFRPVFRGRELTTTDPLDPAQVRQIGLLIANRQAGPFRLELTSITAC